MDRKFSVNGMFMDTLGYHLLSDLVNLNALFILSRPR